MRVTRIDFQGRLDGITRTPQGGIRATANLTRTGIFRYQNEDGSPFLELRPSEEVFAADSLETLKGAPLTIGHPQEVNAGNWRKLAVGHVGEDVRANGEFVTASIVIQDADTCAKVESGELAELSCGYTVELEHVPGELEGEHYDAIQRSPRYNHVAMGGLDWGRAGRDVRVYLDGATSLASMATPVARVDAPAVPSTRTDAPDEVRKDLDAARADNDRLRAERDAASARADKAEAERDAVKEKVKADASTFEARVDARVKLISEARTILGKDYDPKGKSDRDIRIEALSKVDAKFDATEKTDGYLEARFDLAIPAVASEQTALAEVNETTTAPTANQDASESPVDKARREMQERHTNAWKAKG